MTVDLDDLFPGGSWALDQVTERDGYLWSGARWRPEPPGSPPVRSPMHDTVRRMLARHYEATVDALAVAGESAAERNPLAPPMTRPAVVAEGFEELMAEAHRRCPIGTVRVWRDGRVLTGVSAIDSVLDDWILDCGRRAAEDFKASMAKLTTMLATPAESIERLRQGLLDLIPTQPAEDLRARALHAQRHRNTGPAIGRYRLDGTRRRP